MFCSPFTKLCTNVTIRDIEASLMFKVKLCTTFNFATILGVMDKGDTPANWNNIVLPYIYQKCHVKYIF